MNCIIKKLAVLTLASIPMAVNAQVGTMNIDSYNLSVGEIKNIPVMVSQNIASADGDVTVDDNTCLEILEVNSTFGNGNYFADVDLDGNALEKVATIKVKALKECKTNITIKNASIGTFEANDEELGLTFVSGDIVVKSSESNVVEESKDTIVKEVKKEKEVIKEEKNITAVKEETLEKVEEKTEVTETIEEKTKENESIVEMFISLLKNLFKIFER